VTRDEVREQVVAIVCRVLGVESLDVLDSSTARDLPGYDSIAHIQTLVECQRAFSIRFSALEAGQIDSFGQLVRLVHARMLR